MIVCRAAEVWPPPKEVTQIICMRCQGNVPALKILSAIWVNKFAEEDEESHDWAAQMLCEECAVTAIPLSQLVRA